MENDKKRSKKFICDKCLKGFESRRDLKRHQERKNRCDKRYRCDKCGIEFQQESIYRRHMNRKRECKKVIKKNNIENGNENNNNNINGNENKINNNINSNNTIIINNYYEPNVEHITDHCLHYLLVKMPGKLIQKLLKYIWFDLNHPENHSIYAINRIKSKIYNNGEWIEKDTEGIAEELREKLYEILKEKYNEGKYKEEILKFMERRENKYLKDGEIMNIMDMIFKRRGKVRIRDQN